MKRGEWTEMSGDVQKNLTFRIFLPFIIPSALLPSSPPLPGGSSIPVGERENH
jgi:hypothetical protein